MKEFAQVITQNKTGLAEIYAKLLVEADQQYEELSQVSRIDAGRKLLGAVVEVFETGQSAPLRRLFTGSGDVIDRPSPVKVASLNPVLELACLERTLSPIATSEVAGQYFRQILSEVRSALASPMAPTSTLQQLPGSQTPSDGISVSKPETHQVDQPELPQNDGQYLPSLEATPEAAGTVQTGQTAEKAGDHSHYRSKNVSSGMIEDTATVEPQDEADSTILTHYDQQLREDSFYYIIFVTAAVAVVLGSIQFVLRPSQNLFSYAWNAVYVVLPILVSSWSWKLVKQGKQTLGGWLFTGTYLMLITVSFILADNPENALPYLYGYFIVLSSTIIQPEASFTVWMASSGLLLGGLVCRGQIMIGLLAILIPQAFNLLLATGSYFATLDWYEAVQTTALLNLRAQRRRDELFAAQEEIRRAHARQRALYTQLITSVEVGHHIAAVLDLDQLLNQVVGLIRTKLEFTYVGIFLLERNRFLAVRAQAGEKVITRSGRSYIPIDGKNILSLTAAQRRYVINPDIRNKQFAPHPYLSSTALSEIGLPLLIGDQLHGVLNIQSYGVNAFDEQNLPIVRLLANQVAIALHNAQLFNDAILARQEAEQANEIKSRFLASMSHELRTPLNAILNFTGFVADGVFGSINEEQGDALEKTLDSGAHLLSLINDVLDLAKVESGVMDMFIEDIDMQGLLKSTAATATGLLKNKPVDLIVEVDENLPTLPGDKRRLRQILLNLVSNAVKYTKEGQIKVAAYQEEDAIQISVQDTGIGISPEEQALVFESFHRAQGSNTEMGTGLGLPIAKHFVEAHGGQIWLESEVDSGTTFYVRLPLKSAESRQVISSAQRM